METVSKQQVGKVSENQIPKIAGSIVEFQKEFSELSVEDGQWIIQHTREALHLFIEAVAKRRRPPEIEYLSTCLVALQDKKFFAPKSFVCYVNDGNITPKVKINFIDATFNFHFVNSFEKRGREKMYFGKTVDYFKVNTELEGDQIIAQLGGTRKSETSLWCLWQILERQGGGEPRDLLTSGKRNIFFIRALNGTLFSVSVSWGEEGWDIRSCVAEFTKIFRGDRIFCSGL